MLAEIGKIFMVWEILEVETSANEPQQIDREAQTT